MAADSFRPEQEIFDDLALLCRSPGYVHALSFLCVRDNIVRYSGELTPNDMRDLHSTERLLRTEVNTLVGLMLKGDIDYALPKPDVLQKYIDMTDSLLEEIHHSMTKAMMEGVTVDRIASGQFEPFGTGDAFREPIFYGGESAYIFQYRELAVNKYQGDDDWLKSTRGFSIRDARDVVHAVSRLLDVKLARQVEYLRGVPPQEWTFFPAFSFGADELSENSSLDPAITLRVLSAFAIAEGQRNAAFGALHDFNVVSSTPLIRVQPSVFVLFQQYSLAEALYETPFYWMVMDESYRATAMSNRGRFVEAFCRDRLIRVFGSDHVYQGVDIYESKAKKVGEIDVLVLYADRAFVLQAKSKRLTLESRRGNDGQIKDDFKKSVQDSYDQAFECAKHMLEGQKTFIDSASREVPIPAGLKAVFLYCVVSDHYPALAFQSRQFLRTTAHDRILPPHVMDVFTLDAMTEMLESPLHFISFAGKRASYSERLAAAHELTILSYHLKHNLWFDDEYDRIALEDDISVDLDVAMTVRREGIPGNRTPSGVLTRLTGTTVGEIVRNIEARPDGSTIDLGLMLLTLGSDAAVGISRAIDNLAIQSRRDGKGHDFTAGLSSMSSGLTVHCNSDSVSRAGPRLYSHCELRKYSQKAETWFGVCIDPLNSSPRFGVNLKHAWKYDANLEAVSASLLSEPKTWEAFKRQDLGMKKIGRNEPCPCGSGRKYKKCHMP